MLTNLPNLGMKVKLNLIRYLIKNILTKQGHYFIKKYNN